jgi:peptidylprolyl isomerase domain and WD repeat-containing protein 1
MQQAGTAIYKVDDMEFGRRLAMERELEMPGPDGHIPGMWSNAIWDESGAFILYPTLLGIKGGRYLVTAWLSAVLMQGFILF